MPTPLHVDEAGREHRDPDFVVGGAHVTRRKRLAARLRRIPSAWPFLERPLHGAHLRCAGHLARRWWVWAGAREITDPSPDLGLFGGSPAEHAREMWTQAWFDDHLRFQTWVARSDIDTSHPALLPAAFLRLAERAGAPPPDTTDIGALNRWARTVGLRGGIVEAFKLRIQDTTVDALTGGEADLSLVLTRDQPRGATRGERDRYLRMLGATLAKAEELGAARARVQARKILPTDRPDATDLVRLHPKHIAALGAGLEARLVSFWRDAEPGDEAVDLLLGLVRRGGSRSIAPVQVHDAPIAPAAGGTP